MSAFSSDDSTCAPTQIPSPNEFSRLLIDPYAAQLLKSKFTGSSSAELFVTTNFCQAR